jgi:membrane fusion protein, macrolide-specific efflux system
MKKKQKILIAAVGLALLLLTLAFIFNDRIVSGSRIQPRIGPIVEAVYGLGTVIAPQTYQVKTAVNQSIKEIFVSEGDEVKSGTRLIQFDDSGLVRAPFAGTITSVLLKKGELLFPSTPAIELVNLGSLYIEVSLEQQTVLRVKKDQEVAISFESIRGDKIKGRVQSVFPRDSQFIVRIGLPEFPKGILPGMTADAAIEIGRKEQALSIPVRSISGGKVTLIRDGKKLKETIKLGVVDGQWAEVVSSNILPTDEIIVRKQ